MTLLLSLFLAATALAETPVASPALRPATGLQRFPVLATSGIDALAAWEDQRAIVEKPGVYGIEYDVYASRISADGIRAVEGGTPVSPTLEWEHSPAVVWNGDEYVVAQVLAPRLAYVNSFEGGIRFTRIKANDANDNRLVGRTELDGINIGGFDGMAMAWNGREYLVVLGRADGDVYGILIDPSFHVLKLPFPLTQGRHTRAAPAVATDGESFLVTWVDMVEDLHSIHAAHVSASGSITPLPPISEVGRSSIAGAPVIWNGERYLVTWVDPVVRARLFERDGTPSSPVIDVFATGRQSTAAWNGSEFLIPFVTEGDRVDIYAARLDATGKLLDPEPFPIVAADGNQVSPAVVVIGGRFLVAWVDEDSIRSEVVDPAGSLSPQLVVALSPGRQQAARGVYDGSKFGFVWEEEGSIFFNRIRPDGFSFEGAGTAIGRGSYPKIAFNGSEYLVAWQRDSAPFENVGVRIDAEGRVLDEAPLVIPDRLADFGRSSFATDGRDFLGLTTEQLIYPQSRLRPVIITAEGQVLRQPIIEDRAYSQNPAAAAWDGSHYVVVYVQWLDPACYKCNQRYEVQVVLVDRGGRVASPVRTIFSGTTSVFPSVYPKVASGGGSTVAVVSTGTNYVAKIDAEGVPTITGTLLPGFNSDLVWTGSDFVFAFARDGQRISAGGAPLGQLFPLVADPMASPPTFVPGAPWLTVVYDRPVLIVPTAHDGSIRRAFFDFVSEPRRRAR